MAELRECIFSMVEPHSIFISSLNKCFQIQKCKIYHLISIPNLLPKTRRSSVGVTGGGPLLCSPTVGLRGHSNPQSSLRGHCKAWRDKHLKEEKDRLGLRASAHGQLVPLLLGCAEPEVYVNRAWEKKTAHLRVPRKPGGEMGASVTPQ